MQTRTGKGIHQRGLVLLQGRRESRSDYLDVDCGTFDIIDKLRELSLAGDKAATAVIEEFDAIMAANNIPRAQALERELLTVAKDKFELISPQKHVDLEKLQADRHPCAHPFQSAIGEVFSLTAELARFHIRNAVEHLLQHEPAQGKATFDSIIQTIESSSFPIEKARALTRIIRERRDFLSNWDEEPRSD